MLKIVSEPDKLQMYQDQFMAQLNNIRTNIIPHCLISWRPDNIDAEVNWSSKINLWWYSRLMSGSKRQGSQPNRWWNAFGIDKPISYQPLHIDCEINPPTGGINRNIAGAFAEDEKTKVFVVHRGNRWGGGKKGITKALFWDKYRGRREFVNDGERPNVRVAIIAEIGNPNLPSDIAIFVNWVSETKALIL